MIGLYTVKLGERVAIWDGYGQAERVDGPRLLWLWGQTIEPIPASAAGNSEYLVVRRRNGRTDHFRGPATVWRDPVEIESVEVRPMIEVDAHEALVVYRQEQGKVQRRVVRGPTLFMPTADEWLHEFSWHGSDKNHTGKKAPHALRFTKLRVIPDQMYFDVPEVRTADDALLTVRLMVFFELVDVERMLDQTHDPVADFINALAADVIDFVGSHAFEEFKKHTDQLNDLATYPQLVGRAERIGYRINKLVYRGYQASATLQLMHDAAIEARTQLRLNAETEEQVQSLADMKLERELVRETRSRTSEEEQARHANRLAQLAHDEHLRQVLAEHEQNLAAQAERQELERRNDEADNAEKLRFLAALREMQVDMTQYLVAEYRAPDRLIQIAPSIDGARLHIHEN